MPIYVYKCSSCQHELDVLQRISDAPLTVCPQCGAAGLAKQLTAAGFQLKGSGWYATDFKNGAPADAKSADKPGDAKSADKPGDAKSAATPTDPKPSDSKPGESPAARSKESAPAKDAAAAAPGGAGAGAAGG